MEEIKEKESESLEKSIIDMLVEVKKNNPSETIMNKVEEVAEAARMIVQTLKLRGE